jgi:polyisoprenoid-binding protein YceI
LHHNKKLKLEIMMKNIFILAVAVLSTTFAVAQQTINSSESTVLFSISNWSIKTVEGSFTGMKGSIAFTPTDLTNSNFNVCMDAATVNTENEKRDEHLKTEDFFDVAKYPTICFTSTRIVKSEKGYVATGTLTMHGVSKEVRIPFTYTNKTLEGTLQIKRTDFGVGDDGGFMVGEEVELTIKAVLN